MGEGVLQVAAAAAKAEPLQTEGCCWTFLWSRLHPNLDMQAGNKETDVETLLSDRLTG